MTPEFGKRFFAKHIAAGVCAYPEKKMMVMVPEEVLRAMDASFEGKPVFRTGNPLSGTHVSEDDVKALAETADKASLLDGMVVRSFFNEADGCHWAEMLVWNEEALAQIAQGFGVSNAYIFPMPGPAGEWHAVHYDGIVESGFYEHMLLTNQPRYEESKIMTPEDFKAYNEGLRADLARMTNSKGENTMALKFWNKKPVEKSEDFENMEVTLPKTGKTISLVKLVNEKDEAMEKEEKGEVMANMVHKVRMADNSMCNVGELMEKYNNAMNRLKELEGNGEEEHHENEMDEEEKEKKKEAENTKSEEEKEKDKAENEKKRAIEEKAERLRVANTKDKGQFDAPPASAFMSSEDKMAKARELF